MKADSHGLGFVRWAETNVKKLFKMVRWQSSTWCTDTQKEQKYKTNKEKILNL
jgi:hypothetical protein